MSLESRCSGTSFPCAAAWNVWQAWCCEPSVACQIAARLNALHSVAKLRVCVQPCFVFVGEQFDNVPEFRLAKSLLLDLFRGRVVDGINLKVWNTAPAELCFVVHACYCFSRYAMQMGIASEPSSSVVLLCDRASPMRYL